MDGTPRIDLKQLRTFLVVARLGSFSAAARELRLTQPAVSGHVRKLEAALEQRLIDREAARFTLTDAGRAVIETGPQLLAALAVVEDRLLSTHGPGPMRLRIGASTTPGTHVLPRVLRRLQETCPDVRISCTIRGSAAIQ